MNLGQTLQLYVANSKIAVIFGILLVFVAVFTPFTNLFASSGSIFYAYTTGGLSLVEIAIEVAFAAIFLGIYALFVTLVVFSVRREMSAVRLDYYVSDALRKFAWKLFVFYLISIIGLAALGTILIQIFGVNVLLVNLILFVLSLLFLFGPQSIVIEEDDVFQSFQNTIEFMGKKPHSAILAILATFVLVAAVQFIELFFDQYQFIGNYVSILLLLLFVVPFTETLKTQLYMQKYDLVADIFEFEHRGRR